MLSNIRAKGKGSMQRTILACLAISSGLVGCSSTDGTGPEPIAPTMRVDGSAPVKSYLGTAATDRLVALLTKEYLSLADKAQRTGKLTTRDVARLAKLTSHMQRIYEAQRHPFGSSLFANTETAPVITGNTQITFNQGLATVVATAGIPWPHCSSPPSATITSTTHWVIERDEQDEVASAAFGGMPIVSCNLSMEKDILWEVDSQTASAFCFELLASSTHVNNDYPGVVKSTNDYEPLTSGCWAGGGGGGECYTANYELQVLTQTETGWYEWVTVAEWSGQVCGEWET